MPPLRARKREISLLAGYFLAEACRSQPCAPVAIRDDAMTALEAYRWPGNVRELKNVMEFFAATLVGDTLTEVDIASRLRSI